MATSNRIRALNRLPFDFQDGLKVGGVDVTSLNQAFTPAGAGLIGFTPVGNLSAGNVQAALAELESEKVGFARLDDTDGSSLVGYDGGTVQDVMDSAKPMADYTALRAYTGRATQIRITTTGISGFFYRDDADTTSVDNGGTIIVASNGKRWKRLFDGAVNVKWFGAKGNGVVDDSEPVSRALLTGNTVFFTPGNYLITSATISGYIALLAGASLINPNALIINGKFEAKDACFGGAGAITFGSGAVDFIRPEWWLKNTIPGTTDMSPAFIKAIACANVSKINSIRVSGKNYVSSTINISNVYQGIRFFGDGMAGYSAPSSYDSEILGADGLDSIFLLSTNEYAVEFDHVRFLSNNKTTGVKCAIKSTAQAGPARPINIHNCSFTKFDRAVWSVLSPAGTQTGMCQINIKGNTFISGNYSLYAEGKTGAVMNLDFSGNVSEVGGSIRVLDYGATGTLKISDNLLEAQADAIYITGKALYAEISRNYFEANTGNLIYFDGFGTSELTTKDNYISNSSSAKVTVKNAKHTNYDRYFSTVVKYQPSFLNKNSDVNVNTFFIEDNNIAGIANNLSKNSVSLSPGSLYLSYVPTYLKVGDGTRFVQPGYGNESIRGLATLTTSSPAYTVNTGISSGNFVTGFVTLIRTSGVNPWVNIEIYDNLDAKIGEIGTGLFYPFYSSMDKFVPVCFIVRASAASTGAYKIKLVTESGASFDYTDIFVQRGTFTTAGAIPMGDGYATTKNGVVVIPSGATSVIVTHSETGYEYTPYGVRVTPNTNIGSVWVDTITSTQFTIRCSSAAAANTPVYWSMF